MAGMKGSGRKKWEWKATCLEPKTMVRRKRKCRVCGDLELIPVEAGAGTKSVHTCDFCGPYLIPDTGKEMTYAQIREEKARLLGQYQQIRDNIDFMTGSAL